MTAAAVAPAPDRLRRPADVVATLRRGRHRAGALLAVHARRRGADDGSVDGPARLTVVASRKVGGAVVRNRAKRLLREAARRVDWHDGVDVALVARPGCGTAQLDGVTAELTALAGALGVAEARAGGRA